MKIGILGAGPAGLYAAILLKRCRSDVQIRIIEQNDANATWGFGVVFSDAALDFLRKDDVETANLIEPHMERWSDIRIFHKGECILIDGIGFSAVGRLKLLQLLQERAAAFGVYPVYNTRVHDLSVFDDCDLVIAADGLHSVVRSEAAEEFGETIRHLDNRFCWYGTDRSFATLTQTFRETEFGFFNAHHYRYEPKMSTFIVECTEEAFNNAGFSNLSEPKYRSVCETIFSDTLKGARLVNNNSVWRQFPILANRNYYYGNRVLVGDALHSAHFSIGSGTRLAMEDVIALVRALDNAGFRVEDALPEYQAVRKPILDKLSCAADNSAHWYERFGEHMALKPWTFACSYITRSGRISSDKLREMSPRFSAALKSRGLRIEDSADFQS